MKTDLRHGAGIAHLRDGDREGKTHAIACRGARRPRSSRVGSTRSARVQVESYGRRRARPR